VREYLLWSPPIAAPERRLQIAGSPVIISREHLVTGQAGVAVDEALDAPGDVLELDPGLLRRPVDGSDDFRLRVGSEAEHARGTFSDEQPRRKGEE
jgi:hypothetical protein